MLTFGFAVSAYLLYHHVAVKGNFLRGPSSCNLGGVLDCDKVDSSQYSELFTIPVASYGLFYYLLSLVLLLSASRSENEGRERDTGDLFLVLVLCSLPATVGYFYISVFLIGYICTYCSLLYVVNAFLCLLALISKERSSPIKESLVNGFWVLISFVLSWGGRGKAFRTPFLYLVLLVVSTGFILLVPNLLTVYYFEPREAELQNHELLQPVLEQWKKQEPVQLEINDSQSLDDRDYSLGSVSAPIVVVVFSDFKCSFCSQAATLLKSIVAENREKVRLVFRNYPLDSSCNPMIVHGLHKLSCMAATMARCAGAQGEEKFWRMHDQLFEMSFFSWSDSSLLSLAEKLELDQSRFRQCLSSDAPRQKIERDVQLGNQLDLPGTPTIFINGRRIDFGVRRINLEGVTKEVYLRLEHLRGMIRWLLEGEGAQTR